MMNLEQLTKLQTVEYIINIIKEYKEAIAQPGLSDYKKTCAKLSTFDDILKEVEWCENSFKEMKL